MDLSGYVFTTQIKLKNVHLNIRNTSTKQEVEPQRDQGGAAPGHSSITVGSLCLDSWGFFMIILVTPQGCEAVAVLF